MAVVQRQAGFVNPMCSRIHHYWITVRWWKPPFLSKTLKHSHIHTHTLHLLILDLFEPPPAPQGPDHCNTLNFGLGLSGPVLGISRKELEAGVEYTFRLTISKDGMAPESTTQTVSTCLSQHRLVWSDPVDWFHFFCFCLWGGRFWCEAPTSLWCLWSVCPARSSPCTRSATTPTSTWGGAAATAWALREG